MHSNKLDWFTHVFLIGFLIVALSMSAQAASQVVATGKFEGRSDHVVSGGVTILKTDSGYVVVLEPDFSLDGAPDPKLGFGKSGYKASTNFSELRTNKGVQAYSIPASIDPKKYDELWVWCEKFDVPLGVAHLKHHSRERRGE